MESGVEKEERNEGKENIARKKETRNRKKKGWRVGRSEERHEIKEDRGKGIMEER